MADAENIDISLRNSNIVNRLMLNFKSLYGINLSKNLRRHILNQIKDNKAYYYYYRDDVRGIQIRKVLLRKLNGCYAFYDVIYDSKINQIVDVFPPECHTVKMKLFLEDIYMRYGIDPKVIINRKKSSNEIKTQQIIEQRNYIKKIILGKKRLDNYRLQIKRRKLLFDLFFC